MVFKKLGQSLLILIAAFALVIGLTGCTGALTSGGSSSSNESSSSSSSSTYSDDESTTEDDTTLEDDSSSLPANSGASSEYGTLDPDWRSSCVNGYRVFDVSAVDDWQSPPPEVQDLVDRIEAHYDLGLEFVDVKEDSGGWRYYFQDADAQDDPYGGDSLSIKVMPGKWNVCSNGSLLRRCR